MKFVVREYVDDRGRVPYRDWLVRLDTATRARVQARVLWFELGNLGDHKEVGKGVWEACLDFGPGDRVYFGRSGREVIRLLLGGDKKSQKRTSSRLSNCGRIPGGVERWQDVAGIGTRDWPRTFRTQISRANF